MNFVSIDSDICSVERYYSQRILQISDSPNWVLFQPNIVIDAKLGCMWYVNLNLNVLSDVMTDRLRLVELLLQRTNGKPVLMSILTELMGSQYDNALLPVIETIFDKLNVVYK